MKQTQHTTPEEAQQKFLNEFNGATATDRWMAVTWKVEGGKIVLSNVTTWEFPVDDFQAAVGLLGNHLEQVVKEASHKKPTTPLRPAKDLFPFLGEEEGEGLCGEG